MVGWQGRPMADMGQIGSRWKSSAIVTFPWKTAKGENYYGFWRLQDLSWSPGHRWATLISRKELETHLTWACHDSSGPLMGLTLLFIQNLGPGLLRASHI